MRRTLRPAAGAASPPAGVVARLVVVPDAALRLAATAAEAWVRPPVFFRVAEEAVADAVAPPAVFLLPVRVRVGLAATVVPEEADEETLSRRSTWRVAGRGKGERMVLLVVVAARLAGRLVAAWDEGLTTDVEGALVPRTDRRPGMLAEVPLSGLEGLRGDMGRER